MQSDKLFSERQKELRGEFPDVYQYETIPIVNYEIQVIHIWKDVFGPPGTSLPWEIAFPIHSWTGIRKLSTTMLCRDHYGEFDTLRKNNMTLISMQCPQIPP